MSLYQRLLLVCALVIAALLAVNIFYVRLAYHELADMNMQADVSHKERINEMLRRNGLPEITPEN
jgi:hypothetical protein